MSKEKIYIAYGSNLNLAQMSMRCPTAKVLGPSQIKNYELLFRGSRSGFYATVEPCEGASVPVLLWSITPKDEKALDMYEGYPSFYGKEMMILSLNGKEVSAMIYTMPDHHQLGMPSQRYVDVILDGYESANFDAEILQSAIEKTEEYMAEQPTEENQFTQRWW